MSIALVKTGDEECLATTDLRITKSCEYPFECCFWALIYCFMMIVIDSPFLMNFYMTVILVCILNNVIIFTNPYPLTL
jgi:hypothetical protein